MSSLRGLSCPTRAHEGYLTHALPRAALPSALPLPARLRLRAIAPVRITALVGLNTRTRYPLPPPAATPPAESSDDENAAAASSSSNSENAAASSSSSNGANPEQTDWRTKAMQLPLEAAQTLANEDSHYLEKRQRSRWWRRKGTAFPRLPADTLEDAAAAAPPLKLWQKVAPLGIIFFGASFNLAILHALKDAIMVTAAGAETLPFLASLVVLPASLGFFLLYGRMVERLPSQSVFYAAIAPLVGMYVLFAAVLYPAHGMLHPTGLVEAAAAWIPPGLLGLVKVFQYWTFSLFYCAAELWGAVVISVLFWSLANEVCTVAEAKSVYPLMGIAANVALVLSGSFVKLVNRLPAVADGSTQAMLTALVGGIVVMTAAMMTAKAALDRWVIGPYCSLDPTTASKPSGKRKKGGSLADSLAIIRSSSKITSLAVLVVSYGVSHRLFEFSWKGALRALYPTAQGYQGVLADVSIATGWATILLMVGGRWVFQTLGWRAAASATPLAMLLSGGAFFGLSLAAHFGISVAGLGPLQMAYAGVAAGAATQVFARSSKFSLFDPAKEMVYIEMSKEEKSKGKAAVDLLGSQIGKSGGAWTTQLLLLLTGTLAASLPFVSVIFVGVLISWLTAVANLNTQLQKYEAEKAAAEAAAAGAGAGADGSSSSGDDNGASGSAVPAAAQPQAA